MIFVFKLRGFHTILQHAIVNLNYFTTERNCVVFHLDRVVECLRVPDGYLKTIGAKPGKYTFLLVNLRALRLNCSSTVLVFQYDIGLLVVVALARVVLPFHQIPQSH